MTDATAAVTELPEEADDPVTEAPTQRYRDPTPYEKRLRTENARLRARAIEAERAADEARRKIEAAEAGLASANTDAERRIADARKAAEEAAAAERERIAAEAKSAAEASVAAERTAAQTRIIRAEVRAAAVAAGLVDPRALNMLDISGVKLNDAGDVEIPDGFFDAAKTEYPYLFADRKAEPAKPTTSQPASPPPSKPAEKKHGRELDAAEWRAIRGELLQGRIP
jgi:multidrug efflux pump subunit AcrA (membrane-fusion protein)